MPIYSHPALNPAADPSGPQFPVRPPDLVSPPVPTRFDSTGLPHSQGPLGLDYFRPGSQVTFPANDPYFASIEELFPGRDGTPFDASGTRTYTRRFLVVVKTNLIAAAGVCSCPGVPLPYAPYTPTRKEEWDLLAVAVRISAAAADQDDWQRWVVTVNYSTDVGPGGPTFMLTGLGNAPTGTQQAPWDEPWVVDAGIEAETTYPNQDLNGFAYDNSAGQPFTPPWSQPSGYRAYTATRNERVIEFENRPEDYVYVVNSTPFKGYPPGFALCTGGGGPKLWRGSTPYYRVTYKILCKKRTRLPDGTDTAGWQPKILDAGMFQKENFIGVPTSNALVPIIKYGHQTNQPILLNGGGVEQTQVYTAVGGALPTSAPTAVLVGKLIPKYIDRKAFRAVDFSFFTF